MCSVEVRQLCQRFDGSPLIEDLDLRIESGEHVVLLGASGCGKTTLLRVIAGLQAPQSGSVLIDDSSVDRVPPHDRGVAMVFQHHSLYPHMTVRQSLNFGATCPIEEAVEWTGITALLDRYPHQLSGGELRRVAVAKAIARDCRVLLLDEPLSGLDTTAARQIESELIGRLRRLGVTTLHVTHDGSEAMRMADRIAVMQKGQVIQFDTPLSIYEQPCTLDVANSLSPHPLNLFYGVLDHQKATCELSAAGMRVAGNLGELSRRLLNDLSSGTVEEQLTDQQSEKTNDAPAQDVMFAVRPEHVRIVNGSAVIGSRSSDSVESNNSETTGEQDCLILQMQECWAESLGGQTCWKTSREDTAAQIRTMGAAGSDNSFKGEQSDTLMEMEFQISMRDLLVFDAQSGVNLRWAGRMASEPSRTSDVS